MKQCSRCQRTLPADLNFCIYCGGKAEEMREQTSPGCTHCGKENPTVVKFCIYCGKKIGESTATESHKRNDSIFCSGCGAVCSKTMSFCRNCGAELKPTQLSKKGSGPLSPIPAQATNLHPSPVPISNPLPGQSPKKKSVGKWAVIGTVCLLGLAILIVQWIKNNPNLPKGGISIGETSAANEPLEIITIEFHTYTPPELIRSISGEWAEHRGVEPDGECRVKFNFPLWSKDRNKQNISVTQWDGTPVSADIDIQNDTLVIKPETSYQPGHFYTLHMAGELQSAKGNLLGETVSLHFVTKPEMFSESLVSKTLQPSEGKQEVITEEGLKVLIPGGTLKQEARVEVNKITGGYEWMDPLESEQLQVYEIKVGEEKTFSQPIYLEIPFDPQALSVSLPIEHALRACYWDETLFRWVDSSVLVDTENNRLIIPTLHLTKWSAIAIKADGHIYNDYFSMYYSKKEMEQAEKVAVTDFTAKDYIEGVFDTLNDARVKYDQAGFRQLEKFMAIHEVYIQEYPSAIHAPEFNVKLTGKYDENASRNKYTGTITIPIDNYSGVNHFQIAHELFHSVQNRYYYALGMTELGVPLSTAPSSQLLSRQWWLEGSAEYAAGRIAYPEGDKPHPEMGGILNAKHLEKPLTHSPTALAFWAPEDRHSYNNAWFFEFLVKEKKVDFTDLFEKVASYYNPSVYSNLVSYFKERKQDFNEIYSDYVLWWFSSPQSPLKDGNRDRGMDKVVVMDYPACYEHQFVFPEWHQDNKHTARAMKLTGKEDDRDTRFMVLSYKDGAGWSGALEVKTFVLPENKSQAVSARDIASDNYTVYQLAPKDALYVLAINNEGNIWTPEIKIHEADLTYTYKPLNGSHQFSVVGTNIPAFLEEGISIVLQTDGKDAAIDKKPDIQSDGEKIQIQSTFRLDEIEDCQLDLKIVTGKQEIIAQKNIKDKEVTLKINPPQIKDGVLGSEYPFEAEAINIPQKTQQVEFIWDMGDGGKNSTGRAVVAVEKGKAKINLAYAFSPTETKEEAYAYQVQVTVRDAETGEELAKSSASVTIPKTAVIIEPPRSMRYELQSGATEAEHTFAAYVKNPGAQNYRFVWNFGDGSPAWESTGEESSVKHTYRQTGSFSPTVTLYDNDGNELSRDTITVILEAGQPVKQGEDPYRKYDEGFANYDYSKLFYKEYEYIVHYHDIETGEAHVAMTIEFYDPQNTQPKRIHYNVPPEREATDGNSYGTTKYYENGTVKSKDRVKIIDGDRYTSELQYNDKGELIKESNYKNGEFHGRFYVLYCEVYNWMQYLDTKEQYEEFYKVNSWSDEYYIYEEFYKDGKYDGTWRRSYSAPLGQEVVWQTIKNYKDGVEHGEWLEYRSDGSLAKKSVYENGDLKDWEEYYSP